MPNIELHGFADKASETRRTIWAAFFHSDETREFADSVIITTFPSETDDRHGRVAPFARVYFRDKREMEICRRVLMRVPELYKVAFDVEFVEARERISVPPRQNE